MPPEPRGFWKTLEAFAEANPPAAVMASWRHYMGPEFGAGERFLRATARLAQGYPCLSETGCGDGHEVVALDEGRWVARSQEDRRYCRGILLTEADIVVHELAPERLGGELCRVLGFEPAAGSGASEAAPKLWPVGTHPETRSPVYLALCPNQPQMLLNLEGLLTVCGEPFIVLAPTARHRSELAGALLHRERCAFVPLAPCLAVEGAGLRLTNPIRPILDRFAAGLVGRGNLEGRKETVKIEAVGPRYLFRQAGSMWDVAFEGSGVFHLPNTLGAKYVDYLLHHPGEVISAFDLETTITPAKANARSRNTVQRNVDPESIRGYLRELDKLRTQRDRAEAEGEQQEVVLLDEEIATIEAALTKGGIAADTGEQARGNVSKAIVAVLRRLSTGGQDEKAFGAHLKECVSMGYSFRYAHPTGGIWR